MLQTAARPQDAEDSRGRGRTDKVVAVALANVNATARLDSAAMAVRSQDADGSRGRGWMDEAVVDDR